MKKISCDQLVNNYDDVLETCRSSKEPLILENDLIIMDVDSFIEREQNLNAQAMVLESYANRLASGKEYSLEESNRLILEEINKKLLQ